MLSYFSGAQLTHNSMFTIFKQWEGFMANNEKTSKSVASKASKLLSDPKTPKSVKSAAGSAFSQAPDYKKGGK
jgi:hypothetical protein